MKCTMVGAVVVLAGLGASGCYLADRHVSYIDTGPEAGRDAGTDVRPPIDEPGWRHADPTDEWGICGASGRLGSHCRMGSCSTGLSCSAPAAGMTVQQALELRQGELATGSRYATIQDPALPEESAPFNALSGSVCIQTCDRTSLTDMCGTCATCSNVLTQMPLIASRGGALLVIDALDRAFGERTGICRLDCAFDPATRGFECPDDMTCDAFTAGCIEQCTSDSECNTVQGVTYEGELVTLLDHAHPGTCNTTTGRCDHAGNATARVGDPCESADDCAPGFGICLGGLCTELGCESLNCGDGGLCLGVNDHSTLCVAGCHAPEDCGAGQACATLLSPMGGFEGYCIDVCESDESCGAGETCTDDVDASGVAITGHCRRTCTSVGARGAAAGCADDELCRNHSSGEPGWCDPLGGFCDLDDPSTSAASRDCGGGQICDELLASGSFADGHCVDACTSDVECAAPAVCMTSGSLAGLCRRPCTTDVDCASATEICDVSLGACVELP
jgi:hypothetical protein